MSTLQIFVTSLKVLLGENKEWVSIYAISFCNMLFIA